MAAGLTVLRNPNVAINKVSLCLFICFMLLWFMYIVADFICYLGLAASTGEWTEIFTISL